MVPRRGIRTAWRSQLKTAERPSGGWSPLGEYLDSPPEPLRFRSDTGSSNLPLSTLDGLQAEELTGT